MEILDLVWLNRKDNDRLELVISIPVIPENSLNTYLEQIFKKTEEIEKTHSSNYVSCSFDASKEFIQLIRNESPLSHEEFAMPLQYFIKAPAPPIFLNTMHCGAFLLFAKPCLNLSTVSKLALGRSSDEQWTLSQNEHDKFLPLDFDLGSQTLGDLKSKIDAAAGINQDFIFTDSALLYHPEMAGEMDMLRDHVKQCDQVKFGQKSSQDEIGLLVKVQMEAGEMSDDYLSCVFFVRNSMTVDDFQEKVKDDLMLSPAIGYEVYFHMKDISLSPPETTLKSCAIKNGDEIFFDRCQFGYAFASSSDQFADVSAEPEVIPLEKGKWTKPSKGLNLIGTCNNGDCQLSQNGISPMVHWKKASFDFLVDSKFVYCPKCIQDLVNLSPAFHMTQWKYYGQKGSKTNFKANTTIGESEDKENENGEGELLSCDWAIADEPNSYVGFTVVDKPGLLIGLAEWEKLVILTRPLSISKSKRSAQQEKYNLGLRVSIPLIFSGSFNFGWFRDFRK